LLARTVGAWWRTLRAARHVKTLINPEPTHLGQLGKEIDRAEVLHCAYRDFREAICVDAPEEAPSVLINAAPGEANVLGLHAAALAVVLHTRDNAGQPPENTLDLRHPLGDLLNHERDWWQTWIDGQDVAADRAAIGPIIDKRDFSSRVLIVPALYLAADANQAEAALVGVLSDGGFGTSLASKVAATLTKVYPNTRPDVQRHWDPLQPDRLGETLVLEVLDEAASKDHCIRLVCGIFDAGVDEAQAEQSLIVLARASGLASPEGAARATADTAVARQRAIDCIRALLERYPSAFLPAATTVAAGLPEPGPLIAVVRSVLQHADGEIPRRAARLIPRTIDALAPLEAALWQRCNELALEQMSKSSTVAQELDLANQYRWLSDAHERVRVVHFATTTEINTALRQEPVHVLHLSGHGLPGLLELEDENGDARHVSADQFVADAVPAGRMPPVIALAACHTDAAASGDPSFAARLIALGANVVIATETAITDVYATRAFTRIYGTLADDETLDVLSAVADARRTVQREL